MARVCLHTGQLLCLDRGVQEECESKNNEELSTLTASLQGRWGGKRGVWVRHIQEAAAAKIDFMFWFQKMARFCSGACVGHLRPSFCAGYRCHCQLHPLTCWPTWKGSTQMGQLPLVDSSTVRVSRAWQWSDRKVIIYV